MPLAVWVCAAGIHEGCPGQLFCSIHSAGRRSAITRSTATSSTVRRPRDRGVAPAGGIRWSCRRWHWRSPLRRGRRTFGFPPRGDAQGLVHGVYTANHAVDLLAREWDRDQGTAFDHSIDGLLHDLRCRTLGTWNRVFGHLRHPPSTVERGRWYQTAVAFLQRPTCGVSWRRHLRRVVMLMIGPPTVGHSGNAPE